MPAACSHGGEETELAGALVSWRAVPHRFAKTYFSRAEARRAIDPTEDFIPKRCVSRSVETPQPRLAAPRVFRPANARGPSKTMLPRLR